jgi:pimeloyl-ACP methyl ester carboxylesterase
VNTSEHADSGLPDIAVSLPGQCHALPLEDGQRAALYCLTPPRWRSASAVATPLLLVHSVNATASALEMEPVFLRQARRRAVVALDLPGFGAAAKPDLPYTPQAMQQAVSAAIAWTTRHVSDGPMDVMALSLGCEFAVEAVLRHPGRVRTLSLISPTGMEGRRIGERYQGGTTRETAWLRRLLRQTRLGSGLYRLLTTPASIRWFLARSWGSAEVDPRLLEHALRCAALPGAEHAPLDFVAGALFTRGIIERYREVPVPLWVAHGNQGAFTDFDACPEPFGSARAGGSYPIERTVFETGAMPHFQLPEAFNAAYERFLDGQQFAAAAVPPARGARARAAAGRPEVEASAHLF